MAATATASSTVAQNAAANASKGSRNETTLGTLTQKFIDVLYKSNYSVNLNEVSAKLNIKKRRLYDITNVLEGIGLLQKTSKNVTRWNGIYPPINNINGIPTNNKNQQRATTNNTNNDDDLRLLAEKYKALEEKETQLEGELQKHITSEYAYVTYSDIKSCFGNQVVISVKAPPESKLEVNEQLQIYLKSEFGPIEVYLCPNFQRDTSETPMNNNTSSNTIITSNYPSITNNNTNLQDPPPPLPPPAAFAGLNSDGGRGTSNTDNQQFDPTLSSALSISEDEDTVKFLPFLETREDYNFGLDEDYTTSSLFPNDNLGLE